jgi:hypothetical protein
MGYTKEEQNEYNRKYYAKKKAEIAVKQSAQEVCKYCGRSIRHDNVWKHTRTAYCQNRRALNKSMK